MLQGYVPSTPMQIREPESTPIGIYPLPMNKTVIGGFDSIYYWTSTKVDANRAYHISSPGSFNITSKDTASGVRTVRSF